MENKHKTDIAVVAVEVERELLNTTHAPNVKVRRGGCLKLLMFFVTGILIWKLIIEIFALLLN